MKRIEADFRPIGWPRRWLWMCALLAIAASAAVWLWVGHERQEIRATKARIAELRRARLSPAPPPLLSAGPAAYDRSARELLAERALPWSEALTALESTALVGATPRAVEANAADGTVRVEIMATDLPRVLAYLDALNAGTGLDSPGINWSLQSTQMDSAANGRIAIFVGRRVVGAAARAQEK